MNNRDSDLWVPASAHRGGEEYDDEEEAEEGAPSVEDSGVNGEQRGRQEAVTA